MFAGNFQTFLERMFIFCLFVRETSTNKKKSSCWSLDTFVEFIVDASFLEIFHAVFVGAGMDVVCRVRLRATFPPPPPPVNHALTKGERINKSNATLPTCVHTLS